MRESQLWIKSKHKNAQRFVSGAQFVMFATKYSNIQSNIQQAD